MAGLLIRFRVDFRPPEGVVINYSYWADKQPIPPHSNAFRDAAYLADRAQHGSERRLKTAGYLFGGDILTLDPKRTVLEPDKVVLAGTFRHPGKLEWRDTTIGVATSLVMSLISWVSTTIYGLPHAIGSPDPWARTPLPGFKMQLSVALDPAGPPVITEKERTTS